MDLRVETCVLDPARTARTGSAGKAQPAIRPDPSLSTVLAPNLPRSIELEAPRSAGITWLTATKRLKYHSSHTLETDSLGVLARLEIHRGASPLGVRIPRPPPFPRSLDESRYGVGDIGTVKRRRAQRRELPPIASSPWALHVFRPATRGSLEGFQWLTLGFVRRQVSTGFTVRRTVAFYPWNLATLQIGTGIADCAKFSRITGSVANGELRAKC